MTTALQVNRSLDMKLVLKQLGMLTIRSRNLYLLARALQALGDSYCESMCLFLCVCLSVCVPVCGKLWC